MRQSTGGRRHMVDFQWHTVEVLCPLPARGRLNTRFREGDRPTPRSHLQSAPVYGRVLMAANGSFVEANSARGRSERRAALEKLG